MAQKRRFRTEDRRVMRPTMHDGGERSVVGVVHLLVVDAAWEGAANPVIHRELRVAQEPQLVRSLVEHIGHRVRVKADEVEAQLPHPTELGEIVALVHRWRTGEPVLPVVTVPTQEEGLTVEEDARPVRVQRPDAEASGPRGGRGGVAAAANRESEVRDIECCLRCLCSRRPQLRIGDCEGE